VDTSYCQVTSPLGSLQRSPRPLTGIRGPTSKGKGGEEATCKGGWEPTSKGMKRGEVEGERGATLTAERSLPLEKNSWIKRCYAIWLRKPITCARVRLYV